MAVILKNSWNIPPAKWGSFQDVQYATKVNAEKIYGYDFTHNKFLFPMFWGFPLLDYSDFDYSIANVNARYKKDSFYFDNYSSYISCANVSTTDISIISGIRHNSDAAGPPDYADDIISKGSDTIDGRVGLRINYGNGFAFNLRSSTSGRVDVHGPELISLRKYYTVGGTYDSVTDEMLAYVNGIHGSPGTCVNFVPNSTGYQIGRQPHGGYYYYYHGYIYYISVISTCLDVEIMSKFNALPYGLYQKVPKPFYLLPIAPVGWTGKIDGVTNPSKVIGVSTTGISEVLGR